MPSKKKSLFQKRVEKAINIAVENVAQDITEEIEIAYENAVDEFYNSYDPSWYDRTYSTYLASDKYQTLFNSNIPYENGSYVAGINVSSSHILGNPYRADKDWVFKRTFEEGIHGYKLTEMREWRERDWKKNTARKDSYTKKVVNTKTKKERYEGKYRMTWKWRGKYGMNVLKVSPKTRLDRWFKKNLTTKKSQKRIDSIFSIYFTQELNKILK